MERPVGIKMKSRLDKSIEYIRGYCEKHTRCEECKLCDTMFNCSLKDLPINWEIPDKRANKE
jgi:hypothetical protein